MLTIYSIDGHGGSNECISDHHNLTKCDQHYPQHFVWLIHQSCLLNSIYQSFSFIFFLSLSLSFRFPMLTNIANDNNDNDNKQTHNATRSDTSQTRTPKQATIITTHTTMWFIILTLVTFALDLFHYLRLGCVSRLAWWLHNSLNANGKEPSSCCIWLGHMFRLSGLRHTQTHWERDLLYHIIVTWGVCTLCTLFLVWWDVIIINDVRCGWVGW